MTVRELRAQLFEVEDQDALVLVNDIQESPGGAGTGFEVFASRLDVGSYLLRRTNCRPFFIASTVGERAVLLT